MKKFYKYKGAVYFTLNGEPTNELSEEPYRAVGIGFAARLVGYKHFRYAEFVTKIVYLFGIRFVYLEG